MVNVEAIIRIIQSQTALRLVDRRMCHLSPEMLGGIYAHLRGSFARQEIWREILRDLANKEVCVGLVEGINGEDPLLPLVALKGEYTNPRQCTQGTIRHFFARHLVPRTLSGGLLYYDNVLHCPDDKSVPGLPGTFERDRDLAILWPGVV